jgi:membrane-bound ClpP family serine protease
VRLAGERWLAVSSAGLSIPPGTPVVVTAVQGTTLVVWPAQDGPGEISSPDRDDAPEGADGSNT